MGVVLSPVLRDIPPGLQLEILPRREFYRFVEKRFRGFGEASYDRHMRKLARAQKLRPLLRYQRQPYYSPLQIVILHHGEILSIERIAEFERLIGVMHELQDLYMPEVRSNGRSALWVKSRNFLIVTETYSLSAIRDWRRKRITSEVDLNAVIQKFQLTIEQLKWWRREFAAIVHGLDPMIAWEALVEKIAYDERQKLKYEGLLAQDYRDIGNFTLLLLRDLGAAKAHEKLTDIFDLSARDHESGAAHWLVEKYGRERLDDRLFQLELITNDYDINPKPRVILLTEGDEYEALRRLFRARGFDPNILGIEFRSLFGIGDFNFHHWRAFIEYMHEKQVLMYFVIDSERPDLAQQIADFTTKDRRNPVEGLKKVMPRDRILKWPESFEESNFADEEIASALVDQEIVISARKISAVRNDASRNRGLIKALDLSGLDKPRLDVALVDQIIATAEQRTELRPVEKFVDDAGALIALNHQPTHATTITLNRKTGHLG
jgi:hypothetical protein